MEQSPDYENASYFCDRCKTNRRLKFKVDKHLKLMEISSNGLVMYSDVHPCKDGLYEVNNLHVDKNYHIRSFEFQKLPEYRKMTKSVIPLPGMKKTEDEVDIIKITEISGEEDLQIVIEDSLIKTKIYIGRIDVQLEHKTYLESEMLGIRLFVYSTKDELSVYLNDWLQFLINTIEILPPTRLGLLIESIKYILEEMDHRLTSFDEQFIRTILASHEIFFEMEDITKVMDLYKKYSQNFNEEDFNFIDSFLSMIQENPNMPIQYFTSKNMKDLIYQIYLFLILEKEGIIKIERPGIVQYD